MRDYWDKWQEAEARVEKLRIALSDIAASEPIPTPREGWQFCQRIARRALGWTDDELNTKKRAFCAD